MKILAKIKKRTALIESWISGKCKQLYGHFFKRPMRRITRAYWYFVLGTILACAVVALAILGIVSGHYYAHNSILLGAAMTLIESSFLNFVLVSFLFVFYQVLRLCWYLIVRIFKTTIDLRDLKRSLHKQEPLEKEKGGSSNG